MPRAVLGARHGPRRIPLHRQRAARCHDHLGPDRHLRGVRAADAVPEHRGRRLDDHAAAEPGHAAHSARQHPGHLHAHAAHAATAPATWSSARARKAITSTPSSAASASVTRETPLNKDGIKLAELGVGDTFGEEALISEAKRNATVTMLTEGVLMRLNKQDFRELMNEPLLQWVTRRAGRAAGGQERRRVARCAPAVGIPEPGGRRRGERAAVLHPPEALGAATRASPTSSIAIPGGAARLRHSSWWRKASTPMCSRAGCRRMERGLRRARRPDRPAGSRPTSCAWTSRRTARRPGNSRSSSGSGRDPAR